MISSAAWHMTTVNSKTTLFFFVNWQSNRVVYQTERLLTILSRQTAHQWPNEDCCGENPKGDVRYGQSRIYCRGQREEETVRVSLGTRA